MSGKKIRKPSEKKRVFSSEAMMSKARFLPMAVGDGYGVRESHKVELDYSTKERIETAYFWVYAKDWIADEVIRGHGGDPDFEPWNPPEGMEKEEVIKQVTALLYGIFDAKKGWENWKRFSGDLIEVHESEEKAIAFVANMPKQLLSTFLLARAVNLAQVFETTMAETEGNSENGSGIEAESDTKPS